jgi:UDP-N-acetylmuramoyl-tripeptide--D-alanyl-D-alanine ligase
MKFRLREVARVLGRESEKDALVSGWSIDSRTLAPGDLFFALRGPNHDGHAYAADVLRKGAAGVVVDRDVDGEGEAAGAVLRVPDALQALQDLAAWARREWKGDVVAVTGSAGKTTTKDVIAEMLSVGMNTAKTEGNLNNHVGLPLSLLRISGDARLVVLEIGMNHAGEIRDLSALARPDVGVVTNVGYAHIENFDSVEGFAAA